MGLFSRKKTVVESPVKEDRRSYFEMVSSADATVSNSYIPTITSGELGLKIATVYRCVDILSGSIASLPLLSKRKKQGCFTIDEGSDLSFLLKVKPNKRQTSYELLRNAVIQKVNNGNAYILPIYGNEGTIKELILLSPNTVTYDKFRDLYIVSDVINNIFDTFTSDEIIHIRNMSLDGGYTGVSTIQYASKILGITASADNLSLDSFQPGAGYAGFVAGDSNTVKGFGEFQSQQLSDVGTRVESELKSGKKVFWLPDNMKFNQLSMSPADVQLLDTKKFGVLEICRFFGVHPDMVFAGQSTNYKASEMSQVQFMSNTLRPLIRQIESELQAKLIPQSLADYYKIEFDVESMYQTDLAAEAEYMTKTIQCGVYTVNEWRKRKGQLPVEGGDVAMVSCNIAPVDSAKIKGEKKDLESISKNT